MLRFVKPGWVSVGGARSLLTCTIDLPIAFAALALGLSCLAGLAGSAFAGTYGYAQVPLAWIDNTAHTNVTWGGPDLKDLYVGSIRAGYVLKARSPVAGQPHVHQL